MIRRRTRYGILLLLALAVGSWLLTQDADVPRRTSFSNVDTQLNYALHDFEGHLLDDNGEPLLLMRYLPQVTEGDKRIVVVDGERRLGNGWCLPAGPLREPPGALNRAGLVIVNGSGRAGEHVMHTGLHDAVRLDGEASRALSSWSGKKVLAMAGLGNPDRFIAALEAYGIEVEPHLFPDHHRYTRADLDFSDRDRDIDILMTDKDAVKCADLVGGERYWRVPLSVTLDTATVDLILARL